jgi:hypothetical protein
MQFWPKTLTAINPLSNLDPDTRLLYAIVLLRLAMGAILLGQGYTHGDDHALVQELTSQWVDWSAHHPFFWMQDIYHWLVIPNAGVFARLQVALEWVMGTSVLLGLGHQWGIKLVMIWLAWHVLLVAHLQLPYLNAFLLLLLLITVVLWLANAGYWLGFDRSIQQQQAKAQLKAAPHHKPDGTAVILDETTAALI